MEKPIVSILIPNFNHSVYLEQCIESALSQTYENCEIIVLDNSSGDSSVERALKFTKQGVKVCRNQFNILNISYRILTEQLSHGKYFILLCADDYIYPTFIEKAVELMEKNPQVGYVHGERVFVTESGEHIKQESFYHCSFIAPGRNTMPVYMLTTVAHPSQGVVRMEAFRKIEGYDKEIDHMNADRTLWYYLSYDYNAAYLREVLCAIRIGSQTETFATLKNFQHPILSHLTIKDFVKFAREKNLPKVYLREDEALERLAHEFLGYAKRFLWSAEYELADQYLSYARILHRGIDQEAEYEDLKQMALQKDSGLASIIDMYEGLRNKRRNYNPPEGYIEIGV